MDDLSVVTYVNYGDVNLDIKTIMDEKNISRTMLVKKTGLHHQIVNRYYDGSVTRYDRDVLAKLCYILECNLDDILKYNGPKKEN